MPSHRNLSFRLQAAGPSFRIDSRGDWNRAKGEIQCAAGTDEVDGWHFMLGMVEVEKASSKPILRGCLGLFMIDSTWIPGINQMKERMDGSLVVNGKRRLEAKLRDRRDG